MNGQTFLAIEAIKNADIDKLILLQALTDVDPPDGKTKIAGPGNLVQIGDARPSNAKEVLIYFGPSETPVESLTVKQNTRNLFDISKVKPYNSNVILTVTDDKNMEVTNLNRTFSINAFEGYSVDLDAGVYTMFLENRTSKAISVSGVKNGNIGIGIPAFQTTGNTFVLDVPDTISLSLIVEYNESYGIDGLQLIRGAVPVPYEKYQEKTYNVDLGYSVGEVFGGTLDLVSGILTVTHDMEDGVLTELDEPVIFENVAKQDVRMFDGGNVFTIADGMVRIKYIGKT